MKKNIKGTLLIIVVCLAIGLCLWQVLMFFPILPSRVKIPSAEYLPAASIYLHSDVDYDPSYPPLNTGITSLSVDRSAGTVTIHLEEQDALTLPISNKSSVQGCENQYLLETLELGVDELLLGEVTLRNPELVATCQMWGRSEKIRPANLVLREGMSTEEEALYLGAPCNTKEKKCLYFGQDMGFFNGSVADRLTGDVIKSAKITLANERGIIEAVGTIRLPLYAGAQWKFTVSAPGYPDLEGNLANSYANQFFVEMYTSPDHLQGTSDTVVMPSSGLEVEYTFLLGDPNVNPTPTAPTSTPYPTAAGTATPIP